MELVGVHLTCLLKKTQNSFEEAHHWNIQAKFYSVKVPHIAICMMIISKEYKGQKMKYQCGSLKRNSSVPLSLFFILFSLFYFLWPQWLFIFIAHLSSLGSFVFSSLGSFVLSSLGSFPHFRGNTLYITRSIEDLSHFTKVLNIKKMKLS